MKWAAHTIHNRLRLLRAERRLTQQKLAKLAKLGHGRYWQVENEVGRDPGPEELRALAKVLGVSVPALGFPQSTERAS